MAASSTAPLANILLNSIENLLLAEQQVQNKDVAQQQSDDYVLENFWNNLSTISQKLSFECTKVGICFTKSPIPTANETSSLLTSVEQAVLSLVSVFYSLSPVYGSVLHSNVQYAVVRAIQAARLLLKVIKDEGGEAIPERYHQSTGIVWQGCDLIAKCPQDNKAAVLRELHGQNNLVSDAFTEISEALKGDGSGWNCLDDSEDYMEEEDKWTNEDKDLIGPSVNLIKAAKILYKRVLAAVEKNGSCATPDKVKELDQLYEDCKLVSKTVDTLILELYPPLNVSSMEEQSCQLADLLRTALKTCAQSHIASEAEQPHIDFLDKAVVHNLDCMKEKLSHR
ncbi:cyclin-D1-binding protein 1 homolog isoform X1 [Procambarus clarkii]|uniref:cyclin-D1-binding protein 1 homolog isoform X1 n=1 Tax=Procambarus clarkii TaxID=6728 RepID=UPI001E673F5E|nr:cyclin-D1-binding protein 1 homolog [Procambarus clarkii]